MTMDGFEGYKQFQQAHPLIGAVLAAEATFLAADVISQKITGGEVDFKKLKYTAALAPIYGLAIEGLIKTGDFPEILGIENPFVKAALGPNLWGLAYNTFFFVNNTVGEKTGYKPTELVKHYANLFSGEETRWQNFKDNYWANVPKKEFVKSAVGSVTFWNVFMGVSYTFVPKELQTPLALVTNIGWTTLLSTWSLKGRRDLVSQEVPYRANIEGE